LIEADAAIGVTDDILVEIIEKLWKVLQINKKSAL